MMHRQVFTALKFLSAVCAFLPATASADEKLADLPWHLIAVRSRFGDAQSLTSLSVDVVILDDIAESANLFIVPMCAILNDQLFYFGSSTKLEADKLGKKDRNLELGRGLIFSRWGEKDKAFIRPSSGGYFLASDHEGDHVSARSIYNWRKGRYTFKLCRMDNEERGDSPFVWVGAFLYSHELKEESYVGALRFPGKDVVISGPIGSFVEVFNRDQKTRGLEKTIPSLKIAIGDFQVNGKRTRPTSVMTEFEDRVPNRASAALIDGPMAARLSGVVGQVPVKSAVPFNDGAFLIDVSDRELPEQPRGKLLFGNLDNK